RTFVPGTATATVGFDGSGRTGFIRSALPNGTSVQLWVSGSLVLPNIRAAIAICAAYATVFFQSNCGGTGCSRGHFCVTISAAASTAVSTCSELAKVKPGEGS